MTVEEFIGTLESSDRLRIIEGKAEVYVGYLAAFKPFADHEISEEYRKYSEHEVKKFRAVPEITHRRWKELGLMKPLEPDQTAQYKFSDLQMSLYYTIYIQERKGKGRKYDKEKAVFFTGFRYCNHGRAYRWRYQGKCSGTGRNAYTD